MRSSSIALPNSVRLAYLEWQGERGPVLCLPHLTGHKGSFTQLAQWLAPAYRVLALDLRGRGDSDKPADGYGFAYHARDILEFADALGIDSFVLMGHSFGATTATYLASIAPNRVKALVLMDGGADPKANTLRAMYATIDRVAHVYASLEDYMQAMRELSFFQPWSEAMAQYLRDDVAISPHGTVASKSSPQALERDLDQHFNYSMCLHFPAVRCPTLFLRPGLGLLGERGQVYSETETTAIVKYIPRARRVDVAGVNHYTMLIHDHPPVAGPIREFLESIVNFGQA